MQQKGFTLIELIIVIVILGILAVTAAPKFLDLSSDARISTMNGVLGAVRSASQIAHAGLLVDRNGSLVVEGVDVQTNPNSDAGFADAGDVQAVNRYPHAEDVCDLVGLTSTDGLAGALGTDDTSDSLSCTMTGTTTVDITDTQASTPANCAVRYVEAAGANTTPTITITTTGC